MSEESAFRYLTDDVEPVAGVIKTEPEDFVVEEVPLYNVSGRGDHTVLMIEKRRMTTFEVISKLAQALGKRSESIGYAGLKDARAVTRQLLSIEGVSPDQVQAVSIPGLQVLWAERHENKLKIGHLRGNRFRIRIRKVRSRDFSSCKKTLERLERQGVPNFFGRQRFGAKANSHLLGAALLRGNPQLFTDRLMTSGISSEYGFIREARELYRQGDFVTSEEKVPSRYDTEKRVMRAVVQNGGVDEGVFWALSKKMRRFFISAYQSFLFNRYLAERLPTLNVLEDGDVAYLHRNGACFLVESASSEQRRLDRFEISASGPIFGHKMLEAKGEPRKREDRLLEEEGLALDDFRRGDFGLRHAGERRSLRFPIELTEVRRFEGFFQLEFFLPKGCYATAVLEEVIKPGRREPWLPELA
ncbi:MAG: tRNA pseudouridine(13) synthase TruD [Planctomycetota bacterium]